MPIYEYSCRECGRRSSLLIRSLSTSVASRCRHCGSSQLDRLLSRFASPKSEEARLESLMEPTNLGDLNENDPTSVARFMKKMGQEMGEDVGEIEEGMMAESHDDGESSDYTDSL